MREIKFRAWDKTEHRMASWESLQILHINIFTHSNQYHFLQFTGLKDKNGKEIYEGDIVKFHELICADKNGHHYEDYLGEVKYEGSCFTGGFVQGKYGGVLLYELERYEVIGNIYENPELLK